MRLESKSRHLNKETQNRSLQRGNSLNALLTIEKQSLLIFLKNIKMNK